MLFKIKAALWLLLMAAGVLYVVLLVIKPLIPFAIVGIGLIFVYSFIFKRKW